MRNIKKIVLSVSLLALVMSVGHYFGQGLAVSDPNGLVARVLPSALNIIFVFAVVFIWAYGRDAD